ncbi:MULTISPECIES: fatty acid oxidation complex subunit alpha FadJ [unclassified Agarivorans]|uniref:fatty acid oxidation complex subunit alpha FadJ n=1 Tax=unclassified Agarivorans TaxID=2636026 RepID=UPI0026E3FDA8|nr:MULTISPECIES: fatty acid oxidation complex subunit alpha FadJ [unclassified Agarivorans]MDO6684745.1 fatty acid oxidation complex subunit alpha FadJ [Agarivorans sp. 3_MG-2023]MDO6715094.1 fatty acid oxidation complex subunit alpha FadJ [Agarivorans sp. 2_MG-2023]
MEQQTFTLTTEDNIALLKIDVHGETMNTLKAEFGPELDTILADLEKQTQLSGLVVYSGKADSFIAGADIGMLDSCETAADAQKLSQDGHKVFARLSKLPFPVIAAIHGPCLGGGLEVALACDYRVCSIDDKTSLGLPEVQLGLLPGGGGTQRLPKLVGVQKALEMMLTGKQLRPKQALKSGLVDEMVPSSVLLDVAKKYAGKAKRKPKPNLSIVSKLLEGNPVGRNVLFSQVTKQTLGKTRGNYPAPIEIIACVKAGIEKSSAAAYEEEAKRFAGLVKSSESAALRGLFFASNELKKESLFEGVKPQKISQVAVLGGGLMGAGIAFVSATKAKAQVRIKDISEKGVLGGLNYAYKLLDKKRKRRFITNAQLQQKINNITGGTDFVGMQNTQIAIEAVFEDLSLKQQMVSDIESNCNPQTIFASNTSSLPIAQIAAKAERPEQVIGLHYFSPVEKMPLAEIIPHAGTNEQTIADTVQFARKQGKTAIVVKDGAGFYVNRILAPYMNEAAMLLLEGQSIEHLDKTLLDYGFPVGPMTLLDEVGIDVGSKIAPILEAELGERFKAPEAFDKLIADKRLGKKNGRGFYLYGKGKKAKAKQVDEKVYSVLGIKPKSAIDGAKISKRCVYMMLNEAARCLDEGVIRSARDGDLGAIFGIGFPPFLGGPFRAMDSIGIANLVKELQALESSHGERFKPCEALVAMADTGESYYS